MAFHLLSALRPDSPLKVLVRFLRLVSFLDSMLKASLLLFRTAFVILPPLDAEVAASCISECRDEIWSLVGACWKEGSVRRSL